MTKYDLGPTTRLQGLHMVGVVRRRFLVSYPVDPIVLSARVPPGGELSTHKGLAWVSACFVDLDGLRPSIAPKGVGARLFYLIHRTRARLPFPDGRLRESVLVLEASMNRPLLALMGRVTTGVNFHVREIGLTENEHGWRISMAEGGNLLYDATISRASVGSALPEGSMFESTDAADQFLLGVSHGGEWDSRRGRLRLLAETHDPWTVSAAQCDTARFDFLEKLGGGSPRSDHVLTMTDIAHYFALRGYAVQYATGSPVMAEAVVGDA